MLVGTHDGSVCCWDAAAAELRWRTPSCHTGYAPCVRATPSASRLNATPSLCRRSAVVSIAAAPSARLLYSAAADGVAELDAASGEVQQRWTAGPHPVTCIALSPGAVRPLLLDPACSVARLQYGT